MKKSVLSQMVRDERKKINLYVYFLPRFSSFLDTANMDLYLWSSDDILFRVHTNGKLKWPS